MLELLTRVPGEHDPVSVTEGGERREGGFRPYIDLPWTRCTAQLFNTPGIHGGSGAAVPQVAAAGAKRMRTLHPDVPGVNGERISSLYSAPWEGFQKNRVIVA